MAALQLEVQVVAGITSEVEEGGEMNVRLLRRIAKVIQARPKEFDLNNWHKDKKHGLAAGCLGNIPAELRVTCNTTHCIAGWAQVLSRKADPNAWASCDAQTLLDISDEQARRLFYGDNWPRGFGRWRASAEQAAARIEHFIKTKGAE